MQELVGKKKDRLKPISEKVSMVINNYGYEHDVSFEISSRNSVHIVFSSKKRGDYEPNETSVKKSFDYISGLFSTCKGSCEHSRDWNHQGGHYHEIRVIFKRNIAFKLAESHYNFDIVDKSLQGLAKFGI